METRRFGLALASVVLILSVTALRADDNFSFHLSPGPRLVGTRADSSGSGEVTVTLSGSVLSLDGKYQGLLAGPISARLQMGSAPGVRGPKISDLTISPATSGSISGKVRLNSKQLAMLHKGGLYVEIDSSSAPDGDLWGWVLPFQD
jgi:hypothetical protein